MPISLCLSYIGTYSEAETKLSIAVFGWRCIALTSLYKLYSFCNIIVEISQEEYEVHKMWLKHSFDPWTKVLDLWDMTHAYRQQESRRNVDMYLCFGDNTTFIP